jgi:predicted RNA-binding protein with PUA-like domain
MEGLPFLAGGGVNLNGLQIVDITQICSYFFPKSTRPTSASCNQNPSSNEDNFTIVTRSRASEINWTACIFCKHKAFKHDRQMHKVSSENRTQSIKRVAEQISDSEMIFKVTSEDFAD